MIIKHIVKARTFHHESYKTHPVFHELCFMWPMLRLFSKMLFYYVIMLKDRPVLLLWIVIFVRVYWILTNTTITISNHNIRILAPFRFRDPTSSQCFQTGKLGRYQNTKLAMIVIIKILVLFFLRQISIFMNYYTLGCYECICIRLIWFVQLISSHEIRYHRMCFVNVIEKFLLP